jgi:hypothetical protein
VDEQLHVYKCVSAQDTSQQKAAALSRVQENVQLDIDPSTR